MLSVLLSLLFKNLLFLPPSPTEISFPLHSSHLPLNATSTLLGVKRERSPEQTNCPARRQGMRVAALTVAATFCGHFRLASPHKVSPWPPSPFCLWGGLAADHGSDPAPP